METNTMYKIERCVYNAPKSMLKSAGLSEPHIVIAERKRRGVKANWFVNKPLYDYPSGKYKWIDYNNMQYALQPGFTDFKNRYTYVISFAFNLNENIIIGFDIDETNRNNTLYVNLINPSDIIIATLLKDLLIELQSIYDNVQYDNEKLIYKENGLGLNMIETIVTYFSNDILCKSIPEENTMIWTGFHDKNIAEVDWLPIRVLSSMIATQKYLYHIDGLAYTSLLGCDNNGTQSMEEDDILYDINTNTWYRVKFDGEYVNIGIKSNNPDSIKEFETYIWFINNVNNLLNELKKRL